MRPLDAVRPAVPPAVRRRRVRRIAAGVGALALLVVSAVDGVVAPEAASAADPPPPAEITVTGSSLSGITVSPHALSPSFAPGIHDYVLRCQAGTNGLTVSLTGADGGVIGVDGSAGTTLDVPTSLVEHQALVVHATDPAAPSGPPTDYWIRCLPHDFPVLTVVDSGTAPAGWYFTGNISTSTQGTPSAMYAMVLDQHGTPVWYQAAPGGAIDSRLLPDDTISWAPGLGPGFGADPNGAFSLFHLVDRTLSAQFAPVPPIDPHELLQLPNGDRMLFATPLRSGVDLSPLGASFAGIDTIVDCVVQEVDPAGSLVWQWRMSDHVDVTEAMTTPRLANTASVSGETVADVFHCNSIDTDPAGDVLVSARHTNAIFFIDKVSGTIQWKMGGTPSNHDGAQILQVQNDPGGPFSGQHDARFRPNGGVSLYDNHSGATGPARGVEYALNLQAGTATPVWQYAAPDGQPASATGSFRRSADGSDNVIGWGVKTGSGFSEVDALGNLQLQVTFPNGEFTYRTVKVAQGAVDAGLLRATAGLRPGVPGWEQLDGRIVDGPAVASWSPGRLDVFVRGTDDQLWHRFYENGWSGWEPLGGALVDGPAVASWSAGRLDVFVRGTDDQLWHRFYENGWSDWEPLGGEVSAAPAVASWSAGRLDVFVRGTDDQLWHRFYENGWSGWEPLGGALVDGPAVASWSAGRLDVFVRGTDHQLWHRFYERGWSDWERLAGGVASGPGAASWSPGRLDVFVRGTDGAVLHRWHDGGAWVP